MKKFSLFSILILLIFVVGTLLAWANEAPQRGFEIYPQFPGIIIGRDDTATVDVKIVNTGKEPITVLLNLEKDKKAKDWDVLLKNSEWSGFGVTAVHLGTDKDSKEVTAKLKIDPSKDADPGDYIFKIMASTPSGDIKKEVEVRVKLTGEKIAKKKTEKGIALSAKYPIMEAPAGKKFTFELELKNKEDKEQVVDFGIKIPSGWFAYVTPRWEEEKKINSIKMDKNATENLNLTVIPPTLVDKGEYNIEFIAKSPNDKKILKLKAKVTGTYKLNMIPEDKRLNIETIAGKEKAFTLYLWNEGSDSIEDVTIYASKPEGWDVKIEPDKINAIQPIAKIQKPEKVKVTIKAPERTIPGDYMVTLTAAGKQDSKSIDLRVTVNTSTTWGWIGIAIIVIVLLILIGIFAKLKRR